VDAYGFAAGYQSVRRFVTKLRGKQTPIACAVIETAPGEDYGKSRVMVRGTVNRSGFGRITAICVTRAFHNVPPARILWPSDFTF